MKRMCMQGKRQHWSNMQSTSTIFHVCSHYLSVLFSSTLSAGAVTGIKRALTTEERALLYSDKRCPTVAPQEPSDDEINAIFMGWGGLDMLHPSKSPPWCIRLRCRPPSPSRQWWIWFISLVASSAHSRSGWVTVANWRLSTYSICLAERGGTRLGAWRLRQDWTWIFLFPIRLHFFIYNVPLKFPFSKNNLTKVCWA